MKEAKIGIITLSDRASAGIYEDKSGKAIEQCLNHWIANPVNYIYKLIPDDFNLFCDLLRDLSNLCDIIFTTGSTGPSPRDIAPEATMKVCDKILPGFGELMRQESLKFVPTAILSRQTAGIIKKCLIVNLPGQPKAIEQCLRPIFPAIPYCVDLIGGVYLQVNEDKIKIFRPKG